MHNFLFLVGRFAAELSKKFDPTVFVFSLKEEQKKPLGKGERLGKEGQRGRVGERERHTAKLSKQQQLKVSNLLKDGFEPIPCR